MTPAQRRVKSQVDQARNEFYYYTANYWWEARKERSGPGTQVWLRTYDEGARRWDIAFRTLSNYYFEEFLK